MNKLFLVLLASIYKRYLEESKDVAIAALSWKTNLSNRVYKKLEKTIGPIIDDMFTEGIIASNQIVKTEVARLADKINLPFKYNKDLINTFNTDKSVFTGFYDNVYKAEFKKSEINKLKQTILSGKYSNATEQEMITQIRNTVNVSKNRARVIARQESARLNTAAQSIYYQDPKVKAKYNKVWNTQGDSKVRPDHAKMQGAIADEDGWFTMPDGSKVQGPPVGFGDRCYITLEKKI